MRIAFVLESFNIGGAERQAYNLACSFQSLGHEVTMVALTKDGKLSYLLEENRIHSVVLGAKTNYGKLNFFKLKKLLKNTLKSQSPDAILPYTYWPNLITNLVWKKTGAKVSFWNQRDEIPFDRVDLASKAILNATYIVANSDGGRLHLTDSFQSLDLASTHVIRNGVKLPKQTEDNEYWLKKLGKRKNQISVVMVANLQYRKNHKIVLDSWRKVVDHFQDHQIFPKLYLAGRFDDMVYKLKGHCFDLMFTNEVSFLGGVDDVRGLLERMDLGVFASFHEGSPNGILEPMYMGLPVIANRIKGNIEVLGAENPGLVRSDDVEQLSEKLISFIKDEMLRETVGEVNFDRVKNEFSIENVTAKYLKLCNSY